MPRDKDSFRVLLPWPDWDISPNGSRPAEKIAYSRRESMLRADEQMRKGNWIDGDELYAIYIFYEPDGRHRDVQNMHAAMKSAQDGVFDALRNDDYTIKFAVQFQGQRVDGGMVELRLYEDPAMWLDDIAMITGLAIAQRPVYTI